MLSDGDVAAKKEKQIGSAMQAFGYRYTESVSEAVSGRKAEGFRYEYEAGAIGMTGEFFVIKKGKMLY